LFISNMTDDVFDSVKPAFQMDYSHSLRFQLVPEETTASAVEPSILVPSVVDEVVKVELPVDAHLPHSYVPEERLRLEAYRRLADARTLDDVTAVVEELADRYGTLPIPVETLVSIARLRVNLQAVGITEVIATSSSVKFAPVELPESRILRLNRLYPGSVIKPATRTIVVPRTKGSLIGVADQASDVDLVEWVSTWVATVVAAE
jgi:transcription-repair coupling factor (superfamily II helicase)